MSSYSASRRVLFEAQGSLAAAALPSLAAVPPPATFERLATAANQAGKANVAEYSPFPSCGSSTRLTCGSPLACDLRATHDGCEPGGQGNVAEYSPFLSRGPGFPHQLSSAAYLAPAPAQPRMGRRTSLGTTSIQTASAQ